MTALEEKYKINRIFGWHGSSTLLWIAQMLDFYNEFFFAKRPEIHHELFFSPRGGKYF